MEMYHWLDAEESTSSGLAQRRQNDEMGQSIANSRYGSVLDAFRSKARQPIDVKETSVVDRCTRGLN